MNENKFCTYKSHSDPGPGDGGRTGSWRVVRPVIDREKCLPCKKNKQTCFICWLLCPDGVVSKTVPPGIDLEYCKGCGICAEECPVGAIEMVEETSIAQEESQDASCY